MITNIFPQVQEAVKRLLRVDDLSIINYQMNESNLNPLIFNYEVFKLEAQGYIDLYCIYDQENHTISTPNPIEDSDVIPSDEFLPFQIHLIPKDTNISLLIYIGIPLKEN